MIRRLLSSAAVLAIAAGMTVAAPMAAALAAPTAAHSGSTPITCGDLNDGTGAGSANSLYPGVTPYSGEPFTQQNDRDAWRMCYDPFTGHLYPLSADTRCEANNNGVAVLRDCNNTSTDQVWNEIAAHGGFLFNNANGGYLCASGGVTSSDVVAPLAQCSSYHDTWLFV